MSGILFLGSDDFYIGEASKGKLLCHRIKGISIVFFYSRQCNYCQNFIPLYKRLPSLVRGCHFGMINVTENKNVVFMSRDTISKIDYVPYIVLYYHGKPYVQYEGPYQIEDIMEFIVEMSKNLQAKDSFSYSTQQSSIENIQNVHSREKSIPSYSTGLPMSEIDQISYLKFDDAYESKK